ncbi:MAG: FadR family transcriptional regulator [Anaerolineae bacterium]|nr:MAG: FadR family transcriptional regulator [Anaerolineae bacterium]
MDYGQTSADLLAYLANGSEEENLPTMQEISAQLGVSVARLREQMEVAKAFGFVEVRPRTGIRRLPYRFFPAVWLSVSYAIHRDPAFFEAFADLRRHLEACYWHQAVSLLQPEDHQQLVSLVETAWEKLRGTPIRIPHQEHRRFHLLIYSRLNNPFVQDILEAYWEAYEAAGLSLYADYNYLQEVWMYHQKMVDAILSGDLEAGYQALRQHTDLLYHRPAPENASGTSGTEN